MSHVAIKAFIAIGKFLCRLGFPPLFIWKTVHRLLKRVILPQIRGYQDIDGWLLDDEASGLYLLSSLLGNRCKVLEIGSWKGKSTYCLAKGLPKGGHVIAIDPFDASGEQESSELYREREGEIPLLEQFVDNMTRLGVMQKIRPIKGYSHQFVHQLTEIDLLFIDGDHSIEGCDFDFLNYSPLISPGGYLAFHDFDESRKDLGPTWVVQNRVLPSRDFVLWGRFSSLWIAQKANVSCPPLPHGHYL